MGVRGEAGGCEPKALRWGERLQRVIEKGPRRAARGVIETGNSNRKNRNLPISHFLGHIQNQLAIFLVGLAQQTAKLIEETRFLAGAAPGDVVG